MGLGRYGVCCEPVEDVVDLPADVGPQAQELPVDAMEDGLQEVSLPGVLAVKQLQQLRTHTRTHKHARTHTQVRLLFFPQVRGQWLMLSG